MRMAQAHEDRRMGLTFASDCPGTHWLATVALYCLSYPAPDSSEVSPATSRSSGSTIPSTMESP
jgi:hypothetical protein